MMNFFEVPFRIVYSGIVSFLLQISLIIKTIAFYMQQVHTIYSSFINNDMNIFQFAGIAHMTGNPFAQTNQ